MSTKIEPKTAWKPQTKILAAGSIGVPLATLVAWALTQAGLEVPGEVQAAIGAVLSTLTGYLMPQKTT